MNTYSVTDINNFITCPYIYYNSKHYNNVTPLYEYYEKTITEIIHMFLDSKMGNNKRSLTDIKTLWDRAKENSPPSTYKISYNKIYEHMLANFVYNIYKNEDIDILGHDINFIINLGNEVLVEGKIPMIYSTIVGGVTISSISIDHPNKAISLYKKNPIYTIYSEAFRRNFLDIESNNNIITLDTYKNDDLKIKEGSDRYINLRSIVKLCKKITDKRGEPDHKHCNDCKYTKVCKRK